MRRPVGDYVRERRDHAPNSESWEEWLQHSRIELNAFTSAELIKWLGRKMAKVGAGKVIPPDDILRDEFGERVRGRAQIAVAETLNQRLNNQIAAIEAERTEATKEIQAEIDRITADLRTQRALVSEPSHRRIEAAKSEANAIDREELVHRAITRITPRPGKLGAVLIFAEN